MSKKAEKKKNTKVAIIGAGIAGITFALELFELGFDVSLFEKESFINRKAPNQISFNYTINYRGRKQLSKYGLWDEILKVAVPLYSRCVHSGKRTVIQRYGSEKNHILYSIKRSDLIRIVSQKLYQNKKINIINECIVKDIFINDEKVLLNVIKKDHASFYDFDFIVGADGANSQVRKKLNKFFNSSVEEFPWNYLQVTMSEKVCLQNNISGSSIHFWGFHGYMGIGIPNVDSSLSILHVFKPFFYRSNKEFAGKIFQQISTYIKNPNFFVTDSIMKYGKMLSVKSKNWFVKDKVVIIGDAAHSIYPFLGQGMNAALQDVELLSNLLCQFDRMSAFEKFQKIRKRELDILNKKSISHFIHFKKNNLFGLKNLMRDFDLKISKMSNGFWIEEYSSLANTDIRINVLQNKILFQKFIKFTPFYSVPFLFYYSFNKIYNKLRYI